jgi:predicted GH43/DUF377 family glycosyl hydrolase
MVKIVGIAQKDKEFYLYFSYTKGPHSYFKGIPSRDGYKFDGPAKYIIVTDEKKREEKSHLWKNLRVSKEKDSYFITYRVDGKTNLPLTTAESSDLIRWKKKGKIDEVKEVGALVPDFKYKNKHILYFGEKVIRIASSGDLNTWKVQEGIVIEGRKGFFDEGNIEIGNVFELHGHILLVYHVKKNINGIPRYQVGACFLDKKEPSKVTWRSDKPLWEQPEEFHSDHLSPLGIGVTDDEIILYWLVGEQNVYAVSCPLPGKHIELKDKFFETIIKKFGHNPIISPNPKNKWESRATFNSAAVYEDGRIHFLYRALGDSDLSVLGYATSKDGYTIDERSDEPCYIPREPFETPGGHRFNTFADHFASGGGYGGIEDPRITRVGDKMFLTYVAFDGANPPRAAMSSIDVNDFIKRKWDKWSKAKLISAPGMVNKSAVVFPEKVNGKYVVMHRVYPNILIDYLDDLNFDNYLTGHHFISPRKKFWDSKKVGAGAPPMRTKDGWLLIYQSVGHQDPSRYKIGAMMLDINNPSKVLYRSKDPIISPDEHYENGGFKAGVVYPCGAVIKDNELFVYYGGADSYLNGASQNLDKFLHQIKHDQEPQMRRVFVPSMN